jgi:hypothetical protein
LTFLSRASLDFVNSRPSDFEQLPKLAPHDIIIYSLETHTHPQQRKQLLEAHQHELAQFYADSTKQWDSDNYVKNRYSQSRIKESVYATPEIQKNLDLSKSEYGGNVPLKSNQAGDPLSINELQMHLSNQAASLRMRMNREYADLRLFQAAEIDYFIQVKARKESDFQKLVETVRSRPKPSAPRPIQTNMRRESGNTSSHQNSPIVQHSGSPVVFQSPAEMLDLNRLKDDLSLPPFVKFFLHLKVVQDNWHAISPGWTQYVILFQRKHLTEKTFAKAILEDAVRTVDATKYTSNNQDYMKSTQIMAKELPKEMPISKTITDALLEMAETGDVEFTEVPFQSTIYEGKPGTFGPKILYDIISTEESLRKSTEATTPVHVEKATDPRKR